MSRNNAIRGPTSALTDFLREQGINAQTIARRTRTRAHPLAEGTNAEDTAEAPAPAVDEPQPVAGPSRSRGARGRAAQNDGYASDELDEPEEEQPKKKRKLTKAQEAKAKAAAKKAVNKKKGGDDDDSGDEDEDAYNAPSKTLGWTGPKPAAGSFADCARCSKQFTVTIYTMASAEGNGFLCHQCAKASGVDPFKKPKAKPAAKKRETRHIVNFEEKHFPTLVSVCIQIISQHINDVEALGGMTHSNTSAIAKAICKSRTLSPENATLFYDVSNTSLHFTDATRLTPDAFITLGLLNPNLVTLRLDLCGRITDDAISAWSTSLRSLKRLELYGPFLVRVDAWKAFFAASPQLEGFLITQSPRFDLGCMQALAAHCPRVHELRLKEVGKLADAFVDVIAQMSPPAGWTLLDLADPAASLSEGALIRLLGAVAPTVRTLDLSGHVDLSDAVLAEGLAPHARQITHLRLANAPGLSDAGVGALFAGWANAPLWEADFARNAELAGGALDALLAHSSASLRALSLNGWRAVPTESLARIGETCARLERIDLSWCREADDFVVKNILDGCPACKDVKVWACNRLTAACPRKRGVNITGVELNAAS